MPPLLRLIVILFCLSLGVTSGHARIPSTIVMGKRSIDETNHNKCVEEPCVPSLPNLDANLNAFARRVHSRHSKPPR
ncbi:hypothetical protein PFISCL1PPCAC_9335 [Pristionchus fissidentatus]|uniref:Uncharacterized protein n=1 Tax=Pristionchus fissidentatus TaxID=1538716 RepID=A0AAV5VII8_9BILA|nr:hypothetical protein PFISCL1PPCAC_9335 [Pristionchus fissidentatus]